MIKIEYDQKTHSLEEHIKGDSDNLLYEFHILTERLLEAFIHMVWKCL